MRVAGSQRLSGKEGLDDFVAASSEHGGDDATLDDDEDDDLQLANVSEDQVSLDLDVRLSEPTMPVFTGGCAVAPHLNLASGCSLPAKLR